MLCFVKSLPWLGIEIYVSNITISFYRNIVCKNATYDVGLNMQQLYSLKIVDKNLFPPRIFGVAAWSGRTSAGVAVTH